MNAAFERRLRRGFTARELTRIELIGAAASAVALPAVLAAATGCGRADSRRIDEAAAVPAPPAANEVRSCDAPCANVERCDHARGACVPACAPGEVYVPRTPPEGFVLGRGFMAGAKSKRFRKGHMPDTDLPNRVVLTQPFCIDETEVTVRAMKECVDAKACAPPKFAEVFANYPRKLDHPANEANWHKAKRYCEWRGKSLPTEAQWEWAATGGDGRLYPWGNDEPTCEHADFAPGPIVSPGGDSGCHKGGTSPVKSHPRGARKTEFGDIYDLAGNVWEWCLDTYLRYPPFKEGDPPRVDPLVEKAGVLVRVVRGGGWNRSAMGIRAAFRGAAIDTYEVPGLGFRCVRN